MVQVKRPITLDPNMIFQCGRSVIKFTTKKPWNLVPACFRPISTDIRPHFKPVTMGIIPLIPINTGISPSINDPFDLLSKLGLTNEHTKEYTKQNNCLFEHKQIGLNSSCEDESYTGEGQIEEVEHADYFNNDFLAESTCRDDSES